MEPIHVPGPPKQAFNKHRRISDLIRAQIAHLKHLEQKLPAQLRQQIPQHEITTEDDAARYIAPITNLLRAQVATSSAQPIRSAKRPTPLRVEHGLALAAAAELETETAVSKGRRYATTKTSSKSKKAKTSAKGK
jgi:hypothetical protein